jgi:hypothetical protein
MRLPALSFRRLIGAVAVVALAPLLARGVTGALAGPASAGTLGTPQCATSGLVVWMDTRGDGTAGSTYYKLKLTNLSGHACTLFGYPGVSAVNLAGHQLGRAAARNHARTPHTVTLANGATAIAVLQITNVDNFAASACHPVTAAGLRVYPPNRTASKVVPFPFRACSSSGPVYLSVQAVRRP